MSSSNRRRDLSPSRGGVGSSKLRMDRQPIVTRISDPSLTIGRRKEIDNVMKKARAATNEYWDKKLLEVEEKDPNRWRHTGYKKMYIEGESSSESDRDTFRYNRNRNSRSRSRNRKSPTQLSPIRKRASPDSRRRSPPPSPSHRFSSKTRSRTTPDESPFTIDNLPIKLTGRLSRVENPRGADLKRPRSPDMRRRPRSPPEPPLRRKPSRSPRSPINVRKHTPPSPVMGAGGKNILPPVHSRVGGRGPALVSHKQQQQRALLPPSGGSILPRSKRPPSPPPKGARTPSNSSLSSCSDDSCSVCSPKTKRVRSRSVSNSRLRNAPLSPHSAHSKGNQMRKQTAATATIDSTHRSKRRPAYPETAVRSARPPSPGISGRSEDKQRILSSKSHRLDDKNTHGSGYDKGLGRERLANSRTHVIEDVETLVKHTSSRTNHSRPPPPEYPTRVKNRPPEPPEPAPAAKKKGKDKIEKLRARIKIEGEKRKNKDKEKEKDRESSDSDESTSSESSFPAFAATTRLTLSERFGKMAQWSVDRSNMENMRITKDSTGGALKVMIEEGLETPPRRYSYSPAPQGHFPEELATTAPTGLMSWDDVRVRYEYYKSRGYLRDLDLKDYVKWEEWWYRYQEWLKQERYYEFYERQQLNRRRRKKVPITQRLN